MQRGQGMPRGIKLRPAFERIEPREASDFRTPPPVYEHTMLTPPELFQWLLDEIAKRKGEERTESSL